MVATGHAGCHAVNAQRHQDLLVLLCVHAAGTAAVLAIDARSKAVTVKLEALGLLAVAALGTAAMKVDTQTRQH